MAPATPYSQLRGFVRRVRVALGKDPTATAEAEAEAEDPRGGLTEEEWESVQEAQDELQAFFDSVDESVKGTWLEPRKREEEAGGGGGERV